MNEQKPPEEKAASKWQSIPVSSAIFLGVCTGIIILTGIGELSKLSFPGSGNVEIYSFLLFFFVVLTYFIYYQKKRSIQEPLASDIMENPASNRLKLSNILLKEFDYIKETAAQAMNDRHTLINYFLIITGVIVTFVSSLLKAEPCRTPVTNYMLLSYACMAFNFVGWIYFLKIIRLRQAWVESAMAMNHIKLFFINNCEIKPEIAQQAFRWSPTSLPDAGKQSNVFYYSALLLAFITSISFSAIWYPGLFLVSYQHASEISFTFGSIHFVFQMIMYSVFLKNK